MDDIYDLVRALVEDDWSDSGVSGDIEDYSFLEELLFDAYGINIEDFEKLINALLPMCYEAKSELTGTVYQGFGKNGIWLCRNKIN